MSEGPPNSAPPPGASPLWGGYSQGAPPPIAPREPARGEQLQPLSRRLLRTAAGLTVLLFLVIVNSLVNQGEESPFNPNPVAQAAEHTAKAQGARFSIYIVYSSTALPEPITATGSGAYNAETKRSRASLEMNSSLTGPVHIVTVDDGDFEYTSGDTVAAKLPPGKEWVKVEKGSKEDEPSLDMEDSLRLLSSSGGVRLVGHEAVNGMATRRYRTEIQLGQFVDYLRKAGKDEVAESYERIEGLAPTGISAEAWVDRKDMLRRFRMVLPMPGKEGGPALTVDMRMDIFDYGAHPAIQVPDPDRVFDGPLEESGEAPSSASIS